MTSKVWNKLLDIELIIGMVVSIIIGIVGESLPQLYWSRMCWIALTILLLNFILKIWGKNKHSIKIASQWLGSLTLILIFNFLIYTTTSMLNLMVKPLVLVSSIVGIVLLLLVDIPVVVVNFPVVKNWFMRLFMIFILHLNYSYNVNRFLGTSGVIKAIIRSGVIIALATFILAFFIAQAWQLKFQWNLKLGKSKNFQWLALILLLIFSVWFAFFNSFVTLAPSLADLLCFWQWDFSTFEVTLNSVLAAIEAGIFEETLRYLNLVILLVAMRNFKYRMIFAIVISSILFSLSHLGNLGISTFLIKFDLETTLQQVIYTFGAGMLFAVIYLYTGKLWLSISIHGLVDLIALSETPLTRIVSPLITDGWISAIIILLACYFGMNLVILLTNIIEAGYKSTHYICKKTQEIALNKELRDSIEREERSINKYVVTIHTKVKPNFSHKGINVDLEQQNGMMVDFIKNKLGVKPMIFEEGFMYNFDNYGKIDSVLEVLFKVMHGSTPIDYAICIQAGDNMPQLRKLISLKNFGKITMAADTSYRYRFNATHRYQTSQIGVFQNGDKTIEVHEFREFS